MKELDAHKPALKESADCAEKGEWPKFGYADSKRSSTIAAQIVWQRALRQETTSTVLGSGHLHSRHVG